MSDEKYDLIVIGGGPAGYVASIRAAQLGLKTACVEKEKPLGGTCLNVGCIPSKALLESSEKYLETKTILASHGVKVSGVELDLAAMMKRKKKIVTQLTKGIDFLFKKNSVSRYTGTASLLDARSVRVDGEDTATIRGDGILIATGSVAAALPGAIPDGDRIGTSTEALSYPEVPEHLVVIGAGVIGLELGSVWKRLGAKVTVLEYLDHVLPGVDEEIALAARKLFTKQGLDISLGTKVTSAMTIGDKAMVEIDGRDPIEADRVLLAVGRRPNTAGLGLDRLGVETDPAGFIKVGVDYDTSVPGIFAVGDVIGGPMLAHKASDEAIACVEKITTGYGHMSYDTIPSIVYTDPEVACVGSSERALADLGVPFKKGIFSFRGNGRAVTLGHPDGMVKILARRDTDRVLGVHILGPRAGDLIAEAAVAMEFGASSEDIARACHAHPTLSEAVKEAALAVTGSPIHG